MIKTKDDLNRFLRNDSKGLFGEQRESNEKYMRRVKDPRLLIGVYLQYLRKEEYYKNQDKQSYYTKLLGIIYERKRNRLGLQLGFCMEANCFDEGLTIDHCGSIVINPKAKIGKNCRLRGNNCIGNNGIVDIAPVLGDNVELGMGAVIFGDVYVADDIKIGANAVVNKSFFEKGITIAGVPARRVK